MTGERQFATDLDGGRGTACSSGCLSYERPGVSQNCLCSASCPGKTNFCCGLLMRGAMGHMSGWCHFCVSDGDGKGLSSNHTFDYLEAGPARVVLSPQRRSAPLQLSTRLCLAHLSAETIS